MMSRAVAGLPAAALQQAHASAADSVVVESPLPGGVAEVVRFLLNSVPPWVQMGGIVVALIVALVVAWFVWTRRAAMTTWFATTGPGARVALGALLVVMVAGVAATGRSVWNYTQHSNDFCIGCHVMNPAFQRFSRAENKHAELSCHDCHQQPLTASARQLYLWIAERPTEIGEHAKVPDRVCETCHVTADTARWQRVAATAGHRVHLESDSSALDKVQCVTCHGVEVHRFRPVAETCGQSGCHKPEHTNIVLGKMAEQTVRHCTSCHGFTADVPALATADSARGTLVPGRGECLGCHEMRRVLGDFDAARDPHGGKCGTCHNPHEQRTPRAAAGSCAECHSDWRDEPFHTGPNHRRVAARCLTCHQAHASRVDASNCTECHAATRARTQLRPPLPFDTNAALQRRPSGPSADEEPWIPPPPIAEASADSFPHARHTRLACLTCHQTGSGHGRLTFEPPRGCAICHHQAPTPARCATCHQQTKYGVPHTAILTVTVPGNAQRPRPVDFLHARHETRTCLECHKTPVTLAPPQGICLECHTEHHAEGRPCSSCHVLADPRVAHTSPEIAHQRCDACHTATTVARLRPTRSFCSTCHADKAQDHYVQRECTTCHFLASPERYRARIVTRSPG